MNIQVEKNAELIVFRTDRKWTANDLRILLICISKIYEIICKVSIDKREQALFLLKYIERENNVANVLLFKALKMHNFSSPLIGKFFEKKIIPNSLKINHIKMGSPGDISFEGIGEIVKELRQLFKDLLFRNRQEKAIGDYRVLEYYFKMLKAYDKLSPQQKKILSKKIIMIESLKKQGKIISVNGSIDFQ